MEKISSIVGPSARTRKLDVAKEPPVRPGAPSFGRPNPARSEASVPMPSSISKASKIFSDKMESRLRLKDELKPIDNLTDQFFTKPSALDSSIKNEPSTKNPKLPQDSTPSPNPLKGPVEEMPQRASPKLQEARQEFKAELEELSQGRRLDIAV